MEQWEIDMNIAREAKAIKEKYIDLGKIVKYKGEYGVIILDPDFKLEDEDPNYEHGFYTNAYAVRWDSNKKLDNEQYDFSDYEFIETYEFKYINIDGTLKK